MEEKGPFGKSNRRKGSSRTRTATPAKKENPTIESFDKAWGYDLQKQAETTPIRNANDPNQTPNVITPNQPTEVVLFGYQEDFQWQAISKYEKLSWGMICEDYDREPSSALCRYPSAISQSPRNRSRTLTKEERIKIQKFAGGQHWIKITFDSAQAADRAISISPIRVNQHWVYAGLFRGKGPDVDVAIPLSEEEFSSNAPATTRPQFGGVFDALSTEQQQETPSATSNTASTGTALAPESSILRNRNVAPGMQEQPHNPQMMRHFPDVPRTVLHPAHEAFLPQPTWMERNLTWLSDRGLIPAEVVGQGPRTLDDGQFDWKASSFYWKFWYMVDSCLGTDICQLRPDDEDELLIT